MSIFLVEFEHKIGLTSIDVNPIHINIITIIFKINLYPQIHKMA